MFPIQKDAKKDVSLIVVIDFEFSFKMYHEKSPEIMVGTSST
jgi:hypothetical protein